MAQRKTSRIGKDIDLKNFKNVSCTNPELTERFIQDLLRVIGYEQDKDGYIINTEDDPLDPEYITVKGKKLRHANRGILHTNDLIFDPYNNYKIMDEIFKRFLNESHPEISTTQILSKSTIATPKYNNDALGYVLILFNDGSTITTNLHYKDTTKYLQAMMRLESMGDEMIEETMKPYDEYEKKFFTELEEGRLNQ